MNIIRNKYIIHTFTQNLSMIASSDRGLGKDLDKYSTWEICTDWKEWEARGEKQQGETHCDTR